MKESWQQRAIMLKELCGMIISGNLFTNTVKVTMNNSSDRTYEKIKKEMRRK